MKQVRYRGGWSELDFSDFMASGRRSIPDRSFQLKNWLTAFWYIIFFCITNDVPDGGTSSKPAESAISINKPNSSCPILDKYCSAGDSGKGVKYWWVRWQEQGGCLIFPRMEKRRFAWSKFYHLQPIIYTNPTREVRLQIRAAHHPAFAFTCRMEWGGNAFGYAIPTP